MIDDYKPRISDRTIDELLQIVGSPDKWDDKAVLLAKNELNKRNVPNEKVITAKYLSKKRKRVKRALKANEGYSILEFLSEPLWTTIEILFSWELKKNGYFKKAKQQNRLRIIILSIVLIFIVFSMYHNY